VTIHVLVQAGHVGDDLPLRLRHGSPSASEMSSGDIVYAMGIVTQGRRGR
jgi:hypothetical protein